MNKKIEKISIGELHDGTPEARVIEMLVLLHERVNQLIDAINTLKQPSQKEKI